MRRLLVWSCFLILCLGLNLGCATFYAVERDDFFHGDVPERKSIFLSGIRGELRHIAIEQLRAWGYRVVTKRSLTDTIIEIDVTTRRAAGRYVYVTVTMIQSGRILAQGRDWESFYDARWLAAVRALREALCSLEREIQGRGIDVSP